MIGTLRREIRLFRDLHRENSLSTLQHLWWARTRNQHALVTVSIEGENVAVRTQTPDLDVARWTLGGEFISLARAFPREQRGLIVDAGGYIGTAAIALSKLYPLATVVTVEPSSDNFAVLSQNIAAHPRIHAHHAALVPANSPRVRTLRNRGSGEWGFNIIENETDTAASVIEEVATITLDELLQAYDANGILILKMDIEGAEYPLLSEPEWLNRTNILVIELHERLVPGCEAAFAKANRNRFVYADGEKFVSVGANFFDPHTPVVAA